MSADQSLLKRPARQPFSFPYDDVVVRKWTTEDRDAAANVIKDSLATYGLGWEAQGADVDAVQVEDFYSGDNAEFWVVESADGTIMGTAALKPSKRDPTQTAELRKLFLEPSFRNRGIGSFLMDACEERARQLGYKYAVVETVSVLKEAVQMYERRGYIPVPEVETERCDTALRRSLLKASRHGGPGEEQVIAVDLNGYVMSAVARQKARRRRLLYAGVVVVVMSKDGEKIFIQRRSQEKNDFPGALDPFVAGACVPGDKTLNATATRELAEELGLDGSRFDWCQLWNGVHIADRGVGDRCCLWGFVARSQAPESEHSVQFLDGEVEEEGSGWRTREQVEKLSAAGLVPSPVWKYVNEGATLDIEAAQMPFFSSHKLPSRV